MWLQILLDVLWPCCWGPIVLSYKVAHDALDHFSLIIDNKKQSSRHRKLILALLLRWGCQVLDS
jgi:hypothetical protein